MTPVKSHLRGAIHCHSRYSFDSATSTRSYLRAARKLKLDFIILTDHDTIRGSIALRDAAAKTMPRLQIPAAAEYKTDFGDVIAAFLSSEIKQRQFDLFVREARAQGAILLLPHPYVGHKEPENLAPHCDLIEIFNSRASKKANDKAQILAKSLNKPTYGSADSHFLHSLEKVLLEVEDLGDLRTSLVSGGIRLLSTEPTSPWEAGASELIKAWKTGNLRLAIDRLGGAGRRLRRYLGLRS